MYSRSSWSLNRGSRLHMKFSHLSGCLGNFCSCVCKGWFCRFWCSRFWFC
uniref:Uncharacterized protein n=1 Tax=Manihot esculenta TaxID=3983 RepID=A0A2C9UWF4_MANES